MNFLNQPLAWGALAFAIPLILHILNALILFAVSCALTGYAQERSTSSASGVVVDKSEVRFSRGSALGACLPGPRHKQEARIEVADTGSLSAAVTCRFRGRALVPARRRLGREVEQLRLALEG